MNQRGLLQLGTIHRCISPSSSLTSTCWPEERIRWWPSSHLTQIYPFWGTYMLQVPSTYPTEFSWLLKMYPNRIFPFNILWGKEENLFPCFLKTVVCPGLWSASKNEKIIHSPFTQSLTYFLRSSARVPVKIVLLETLSHKELNWVQQIHIAHWTTIL